MLLTVSDIVSQYPMNMPTLYNVNERELKHYSWTATELTERFSVCGFVDLAKVRLQCPWVDWEPQKHYYRYQAWTKKANLDKATCSGKKNIKTYTTNDMHQNMTRNFKKMYGRKNILRITFWNILSWISKGKIYV